MACEVVSPPDRSSRLLSRRDLALVLAASVFLTLAHGLHFLVSNQMQYFLLGLRLHDPSLLPNDWFTWHTTHYHVAFGHLLWLLAKLGPLVVTTQVVQWLAMVAYSLGLFLLARRFCKHSTPVFLLVVLWSGLAFQTDTGLGKLYLVSEFLQPSQVAGPLLILGLAALFDRRFLASGLALGVAGVFHTGILLAGAPVVAVQAWACKPWKRPRDLARFLLPLGLLWGVAAAATLWRLPRAAWSDPGALDVLISFRAPHHHTVAAWPPTQSLAWGLWIVLGSAAVFALPHDAKHRELRISFLAALAACAAGLAFAVLMAVPAAIVALPWRIAPWAFWLGLLCILDRWAGSFLEAGRWRAGRVAFVLGVLMAAGLWIARSPTPRYIPARAAWLASIPAAAVLAWAAAKLRVRRVGRRRAAALLLAALMAGVAFFGLTRGSSIWDVSPAAAELEGWLREHTPPAAILAVRPDMGFLRLRARRALVVDWKCFPMVPGEIAEWFRRLCDVCGMREGRGVVGYPGRLAVGPGGAAQVYDGYARLNTARAVMLRRRYGARYVVIDAEHTGDVSGLTERFRNRRYAVCEIPAP